MNPIKKELLNDLKKLKAENKRLKETAVAKYLSKVKKRLKDTEDVNAGLVKEVYSLHADLKKCKDKIERMKKNQK